MGIGKFNNKGITTISLVVTIIILLILAAVSLRLGFDKNGIITRAQDAVDKEEEIEMIEEVNYLFSKADTAQANTGVLEYLDDLKNQEDNQNDKLKSYELIQDPDDPNKYDLLVEWKPDEDDTSTWLKLEKNVFGNYEVTDNYGGKKPSEIFLGIIKLNFYSDNSLIGKKVVPKGKPIGELPTVEKDSFIFKGWYTEKEGAGILATASTLAPTKVDEMNYYALWVEKSTGKDMIHISLSESANGAEKTEYTYSGEPIKPIPTVKYNDTLLHEGTDYRINYSTDTVSVGVKTVNVQHIEGGSEYSFNENCTYIIKPKNINELSIELSETSYVYDGTAKKPTVTIKHGNHTLVENTEYTITYTNNIESGTATVKITGKGNYTGSVSKSFIIDKANVSGLKVEANSLTYNTAAQELVTVEGNIANMHYKLDNGSWESEIPKATEPGSYTVYWYMEGTSNYNEVGSESSPESTIVTINDLTYTVTYDANGGKESKTEQIRYMSNPTLPSIKRSGYSLKGWYTAKSGGTKIKASYKVTEDVTFYAQWKRLPVRYAVQIYGINQDVDADNNTLGLTFGPAVGADYYNAYVTHKYEETNEGSGEYYVKIVTHTVADDGSETTSEEYLKTSSKSKVVRTAAEKEKYDINMHEMTWTEIAAVPDKTAFLDCMLCGDTKRVNLTLNTTVRSSNLCTANGDGSGMLIETLKEYYKIWNPSIDQNAGATNGGDLGANAKNAGAYASSHIRATLIGENEKTNLTYAGDVNLTESTCLYSCLDNDLKNVIKEKKIKYITGTSESSYSINSDIADKIWLFADRELSGIAEFSGNGLEGFGTTSEAYDKFQNIESKYYMSSYKASGSPMSRKCYNESGETIYWWLRSPYLKGNGSLGSNMNGNIYSYNSKAPYGIAFGFCID